MTVEKPITTGADSVMKNQNSYQLPVNRSKRRKNRAYKVRLVLVLLLIGWKTGASQ